MTDRQGTGAGAHCRRRERDADDALRPEVLDDAAELTKQGGGGLIKQPSSLGDFLRSIGGVEAAPEHVFKRLR